jgi:hypothetical protein
MILPISASQDIAKITGKSHQCLAGLCFNVLRWQNRKSNLYISLMFLENIFPYEISKISRIAALEFSKQFQTHIHSLPILQSKALRFQEGGFVTQPVTWLEDAGFRLLAQPVRPVPAGMTESLMSVPAFHTSLKSHFLKKTLFAGLTPTLLNVPHT